jgi:hypothetical protein
VALPQCGEHLLPGGCVPQPAQHLEEVLVVVKSRIGVAVGSAMLLIALSAGSVLAGEVTGNGDPTPVNGYVMNSICAFSGQNDGNPPPGRTAAHVQNWGQIPKAVRDEITLHPTEEAAHPSLACNGHSGALSGE